MWQGIHIGRKERVFDLYDVESFLNQLAQTFKQRHVPKIKCRRRMSRRHMPHQAKRVSEKGRGLRCKGYRAYVVCFESGTIRWFVSCLKQNKTGHLMTRCQLFEEMEIAQARTTRRRCGQSIGNIQDLHVWMRTRSPTNTPMPRSKPIPLY